MRISTNTLYEAGAARLGSLQSALVKTQQQISSNRRILTPADDPVAAAAALQVTQAQSTNTQLAANRKNVQASLSAEEGVLQGTTSLLQDVKVLIVNAGNGTIDDAQRKDMAAELSGRFEELMALANTRDGTGNTLFSGYQTSSQPFAKSATGAQYSGDQGQRLQQVGAARQMAVSDSGTAVFENNKTGNGTFVTAASAANQGTGVVSSGTVVNGAVLTGHQYDVNFTVAAGVTTYDIVDNTTGLAVPPGANAYTSGQSISFDGLQFDIKGVPADGDKFSVASSTDQSIFTTLSNLINVLNTSAATPAGKASLANGLNEANNNIDHAIDTVLSVRSSVGSRLKEIDSLDSAGEDRNIQYAQTLSQLQDIDYNKAITDLTQQQTTLEAAQKSFLKISGLSLFNFL
jgi:flagellar hook-associated protein 3 FlgL